MTHGIFFTHSRKWLGRVSRRRTSGVISGHLVTSGLFRTHKIGDFNFSILATRWRQKIIFWLHHCNQRVTISNPTSFAIFPIIITFILKTDRLSVIVARQGNLLRRSATKVLENSLLSRIELLHTEKRTVFLHHSNEVLPYIICGA